MKESTLDQPTFFRQLDDFIRLIPQRVETPTATTIASQDTLLDNYLDSYLHHYSISLNSLTDSAHHEIWQSEIGSHRIVEQRWLAKKPNGQHLILCHGYFDHTALYGKVIRWALAKGYCLHSFDLPGHGLSGGKRASINSFDEYSHVLSTIINREHYARYICIGQSTGCAVILNAILNDTVLSTLKRPERIILLAPLVRSIHWQVLRWPYFLLHSFFSSIKRAFAESSHDKKFNEFLYDKDPLQATKLPLNWLGAMDEWIDKIKKAKPDAALNCTIIQGTGDNTVDYKYNLPVIKHYLPKTNILYIDHAFHHLANESDEYWQQVKTQLNQSCI